MRRHVAAVVLGLLAHGAWASSSAPCSMGLATAAAMPVAAVVEASPAVVHHHGHGPASPSAPAPDERESSESPGPYDVACLHALGCAPMVAPLVPEASRLPARPSAVVPSGADAWHDGIERTVEPPPPRAG